MDRVPSDRVVIAVHPVRDERGIRTSCVFDHSTGTYLVDREQTIDQMLNGLLAATRLRYARLHLQRIPIVGEVG